MIRRLNVSNYVLVYEDENRIFSAVLKAVMLPEEQSAWLKSFEGLSEAERNEAIREFVRPAGTADELTSEMFPADTADEQSQVQAFNQLDESDKQAAANQGQYLAIVFLGFLHNTLSRTGCTGRR